MSDTVTAPVDHHDAGSTPAEAPAAPLFRFDPGWMFVLAGLAVCVAGVLLPAQADLHALRQQLNELKSEESRWYSRLKAHGDFLDQVDRGDADLVRRLAASQLNVIPSNETPVLLAPTGSPPLTQWIDNTVKSEPSPVSPLPISSLSRLANGPDRLWLFAGGIMCVFIGLLMGPGVVRPKTEESAAEIEDDAVESEAALEDTAPIASTVLVEVTGEEDELLSQDQVISNVLVEVPPASQTIEHKELPESAASALSSTPEEIGTPVTPSPAVNLDPSPEAAPFAGNAADDAQDNVEPTETAGRSRRTSPNDPSDHADDEIDGHRSPLVEAKDDADDTDEHEPEDWPLTRRSHRSNRFEDTDESHERSSRE